MANPDLNLLRALDALLATGSVTEAAARLGLSVSAMSRNLTRLRKVTGDPLLVRAGSRLVPSPRAVALSAEVPALLAGVESALARDEHGLELKTLSRTFSLRANEGFIHRFAAPLLQRMLSAAPQTRLKLAAKRVKDGTPLREGAADLEIGVLGEFAPEILTRRLFDDEFIAAARPGHALLDAPVTPERFANCLHVVASRRGQTTGPVDEALARLGLVRKVVAVVPGFPDAMEIARRSDVIAQIPRSVLSPDLVGTDLPVSVPGISVSAMWHPRFDVDPEQKWFREMVFETVLKSTGEPS
ncbi:DNA-binding transcriptional LysR family regulator [Rhodopseudomonas julia]|uniref:DNA-binding transcriptional LysR family regulator n=1 Tax=Rhodopseudomonas julia TaxID=200617 RepID=A0ABU0C249_9BRAD|nr:LysR family transcriptional regulator [Rhodopseudomonas julia]MDQ0324583.1 DNA-binding transcriptional LysR family regulator [Rhodopseudomonas julia]